MPNRCKMMLHMAMHIDAKYYRCILCDGSYNTKKLLKLHVKHMHRDGPPKSHVCEFCAAQFRSYGSLKVHRRIHTNEQPYQCDVCPKTFKYMKSKKLHQRTHHATNGPGAELYLQHPWLAQLPEANEVASAAEKQFSYSLLRRLRKGQAGKILLCDLCGSQQNSRKEMLNHMAMHIGTKSYKCIVCSRMYTTKNQLLSHVSHMHLEVASESSEKHGCEQCLLVFSSAASLSQHRRTHATLTQAMGLSLVGDHWMLMNSQFK